MSKQIPALIQIERISREAKGRPARKGFGRITRQKIPRGAARQYRSALFDILENARRLVDQRLIPRLVELERRSIITTEDARLDVQPFAQDVQRIVGDIQTQFEAQSERDIMRAATEASGRTQVFNKNEITRQLTGVLGVDVLVGDNALGVFLDASIRDNVALIKTVEQRYFSEVENAVLRGFRTGTRANDIGDEIAARFDVTRKRAAFIAVDQINKLNGELTRNRQIGLGINGYRWRTSRDDRVRFDHNELDGTLQSWDNPPIVDSRTGRREHPGGDFNCRCTAEPDLDSLLV